MRFKCDFYEGESITKDNVDRLIEVLLSKDMRKYIDICKRTKNQRIFNKNLKKINSLFGGNL